MSDIRAGETPRVFDFIRSAEHDEEMRKTLFQYNGILIKQETLPEKRIFSRVYPEHVHIVSIFVDGMLLRKTKELDQDNYEVVRKSVRKIKERLSQSDMIKDSQNERIIDSQKRILISFIKRLYDIKT